MSTALGLSERDVRRRQSGIGASEVPAVIGLVPGIIDVYARKVGESENQQASDLLEFGHRIEDVISDAFVHRHPGLRTFKPGTLRHPKAAWALATPDRVVAPPGVGRPPREEWLDILEIKTVFFSGRDFGESGSNEIPDKYLVQVAWQMAVTGMPHATLVALVNGSYREYRIAREMELEEILLAQVEKFWVDHVLARVPPPVDGSAAYGEYLRRRHPRDSGLMLPPSPETEALTKRLRQAKAVLKEAEGAEAEAKQALQSVIGDASGIEGLCTWRTNKDSHKTDWEAVLRDFAATQDIWPEDLIKKHTTTKLGARVLRLIGKE